MGVKKLGCSKIMIVGHLGCMPNSSAEIYKEFLKIATICNSAPIPVPDVTYYDSKENIEKFIESIDSAILSLNNLNEAIAAPAKTSPTNPNERSYNKRRFR